MSSDRGPVIYGLESQGRALTARALAARAGETDNIHFLVGTQSLRQENQVHLLEYCEETGVLDKTVFLHSCGEIWYVLRTSRCVSELAVFAGTSVVLRLTVTSW